METATLWNSSGLAPPSNENGLLGLSNLARGRGNNSRPDPYFSSEGSGPPPQQERITQMSMGMGGMDMGSAAYAGMGMGTFRVV